ncbi:hypothetical protein A2U01_0006319 [Trifolium medium]|uniref:Uncharacterized protein n=1 Tax=Trifolium medium TaxID=97028 RepID=A0A392ME88_9FABA|nr:hypothetical protein [Trifolium medium]
MIQGLMVSGDVPQDSHTYQVLPALSQLNGCLHFYDARRVTDVEYLRLSYEGTDRSRYYKLVRSVEAISSNLIRPRTFDENAACVVEPSEDEVETVNLSDS